MQILGLGIDLTKRGYKIHGLATSDIDEIEEQFVRDLIDTLQLLIPTAGSVPRILTRQYVEYAHP